MIKFWSICQNTFLQTIRQPIFCILILVTFGALVMTLATPGWTMATDYHASDQRMLQNGGLLTLLVSGLLVAAFSASGVIAREIEDKTALTVISKPVTRATFILGKFAGVSAAVMIAVYLCAIVFLMTVRHRVMPAVVDPYDMPVITLGLLALGLSILVGLGGNLVFNWNFSSAAVWSALLLFSIAMGVLSFVGKNWEIVPLGYDTQPKTIRDLIRVKLKSGFSVEDFERRSKVEGYLIDLADRELGTMDVIHPSVKSLDMAVRDLRTWEGIESAEPMTDPPAIDGQLLIAILLVFMAVLIFCAIAVAASTRLGQVLTLLVCLAVFVAGSEYPHFAAQAREVPAFYALVWLVPNLSYFYALDTFNTGQTIPLIMVGQFALYCVIYVAAVMALAVALFQRRQVEAQATATTMPSLVNLLAWTGRAVAAALALLGGVYLSQLIKTPGQLGLIWSAGVLLAAAFVVWVLWGYFGRGVRWSYWVILTLTVLNMLWNGVVHFVPQVREDIDRRSQPELILSATVSAAVLLILALPKTRHHFDIPRPKDSKRSSLPAA